MNDKDSKITLPQRAVEDIVAWTLSVLASEDNVSRLIRLHALTESYLNRLLFLLLPEPVAVLSDRQFTYFQKLQMVKALCGLPGNVTEALRRLTKLRNKLSHSALPQISSTEIEYIAQPINQEYQLTLADHHADGIKKDEMHALAWTLFAEITLRIGPYEELSDNYVTGQFP